LAAWGYPPSRWALRSWRGTSLLPRPPVIILNSSPVIHLTVALGGLDALPALYGQVLVPEPVLRE